jgi:hypothetical protein
MVCKKPRAFVAAFTVSVVACGSSTTTPPPPDPYAAYYPPPGYAPTAAPPGYPPPPSQPYPAQPGYPPAPAPAGTMATPGPLAMPCQSDSSCLTAKCNTQYGKCAFPCQSAADCAAGNGCNPMSGLCLPGG